MARDDFEKYLRRVRETPFRPSGMSEEELERAARRLKRFEGSIEREFSEGLEITTEKCAELQAGVEQAIIEHDRNEVSQLLIEAVQEQCIIPDASDVVMDLVNNESWDQAMQTVQENWRISPGNPNGEPHGNPNGQGSTVDVDRDDLTSRIAEANRQATRLQRCDALAVELINTSAAAILLAQDYEPTDDELLEIEEAMSKLIPRLQANGCVTDEEAEALADNRDFLLQGMRQDVLTFVEDSDDNIQRIVFGLL